MNEKKVPIKLLGVKGFDDRANDIVYCSPAKPSEAKKAVVYFGGDIQDFAENMETHRDNKNYVNWSLENTSLILRSAFPQNHIFLIRPAKMEFKTFSCFENFVPSGNCGVPHHISMHHSLNHLEKILESCSTELNINLTDCDLILIGFSKGCVVLNQFLYEFHTVKEKDSFIGRIKDMYWLDGGHSGGKTTWVTSKRLLEALTTFGINVHIHVSPYQIMDDRRPWIKKEEKIFYNTLCSLKASVERRVHSADMAPDILQHFNVLKEFHEA